MLIRSQNTCIISLIRLKQVANFDRFEIIPMLHHYLKRALGVIRKIMRLQLFLQLYQRYSKRYPTSKPLFL